MLNMKFPKKAIRIIVPIVIFLITSAVAHMTFWFNAEKQPYPYVQNLIVGALYSLSIISYIQSIRISNSKVKNHLPSYNHPIYFNNNTCMQDGGRFKPMRTSHCQNCGCVLRMDHHCPSIGQCVGLRNSRAFILFCLYTGILAGWYSYDSVSFYKKITTDEFHKISLSFLIFWMTISCLAVLFLLSLASLSLIQLWMVGINITTLDSMKSHFNLIPNKKKPNPFDLGFFTNISLFFQYDTFLFWLPFGNYSQNDGVQYPNIPPVLYNQIIETKNIKQQFPQTLTQLHEKYDQYYKNTTFVLQGNNYTLKNILEKDNSNNNQIIAQNKSDDSNN